jgi:hypothetical protein
MDERTVKLADDLAEQVHPELGQFVLDLAESGMSHDDIMAKLRSIMTVAEAGRNA